MKMNKIDFNPPVGASPIEKRIFKTMKEDSIKCPSCGFSWFTEHRVSQYKKNQTVMPGQSLVEP